MLAVICDDNENDRRVLTGCARRWAREKGRELEIQCYAGGDALLASASAQKADVVLLDIYMDGTLGTDTARALRRAGYAGAILLVTASAEHYADGFEVEAAHYLLKPVAYPAFAEAMARVQRRLPGGQENPMLSIISQRVAMQVPQRSILHIEARDHRVLLHTAKGVLSTRQPIGELQAALGPAFLRCHRGHIVNMEHVAQLAPDGFVMKNGARVPCTKEQMPQFKQLFMQFSFSRMEG